MVVYQAADRQGLDAVLGQVRDELHISVDR
ncbi:hypothetical protein ACFWG7_19215 [Streptomyces koyangensis]